MTFPFAKDRLRVLHARNAEDVLACQQLRHLCFRGEEGVDRDQFDDRCRHLMVIDGHSTLVATARYQLFHSGRDIAGSYAAQCYDLEGISRLESPLLELGRFCVAPQMADADALRMAWAALTRIVDAEGVRYLFGCASFQGTDPTRYGMVFQHLARDHQGPEALRPNSRGAQMIPLAQVDGSSAEPMPRLLRSYLTMGGWVGAEATIDEDMATMHVFTCLDVQSVPPARARALRALAEGIDLA